MHEYVFKMKKGDIEIELKSDDLEFVEEQLNKWREELLQQASATLLSTANQLPSIALNLI